MRPIDQKIIDVTIATRTPSNFVDKGTRPLDRAIETNAEPWFAPPSAISHEIITEVIDELFLEFDIKNLEPTTLDKVTYRKSVFFGLPYLRRRGDPSVYEDAFPKARKQLKRA